ncbi:hypothetical protein O181_041236 [Austropuccinia psidii MF-1]|uniref:Signal peptidase complex subunit 2 n=1 Tax=Austropuccinia psidii MF-1 TaxID=1389203 RepID=A0A9Q3HE31_9BASI|nr:hypothetical protein [Austropuccinia psidii MF-1]
MAQSKSKKNNQNEKTPLKEASRNESGSDVQSDSDDSVSGGDDLVPIQVNNASLTELKNALDDATKTYFNTKAGFQQDFFREDVKLTLGWISSILAGGISLAGWYFGWDKTKDITGYFVAAYLLLSTAGSIFSATVEKKIIYAGTRPSKTNGAGLDKMTVSTDVESHQPIYQLEVLYETSKKSGPKVYQTKLKPHFKDFFDVDGYLDESGWHSYLQNILSTAVSKS